MPTIATAEPVPLTTDEEGSSEWLARGALRSPLDTIVAAYSGGDTPKQIAQDYSSLRG